MAKRKEGYRVFYIEVPDELATTFIALAEANDRTLTAEVLRALRRHVEGERAGLGPIPQAPAAAVGEAAEAPARPPSRGKGRGKGRGKR
jgi:hypothetical protein